MTRPLRIGIFVMQFPQRSETFIVTKVLKLLDHGFDVQIFSVAESPHWDAFEVLKGRDDVRARVHVAPPVGPARIVLTRGALGLAAKAVKHPTAFARYLAHNWRTRNETKHGFLKSVYLRSAFLEYQLDILHIEFDFQGVGIADLKEFFGCHVLLSSRGTFELFSVLDTTPDAPKYLFKYVDGYHFISEFLDRNTHRLGLPDGIPAWLIPPAVDLTLFEPPPREARTPPLQLISVGRLSWEKGYEVALDAIKRVRAAGIELRYTIYGAGPYAEPIRYAIQQLELGDCVEIRAVRREDMPEVYANADIMVHAAFSEGFCNAVIEAQAMQLPVVTSDAGGLPENVEDGVTGYVVPRRDAEAIAAKIMVLAREPSLRQRFGLAGRARALSLFDLDRQAEAFVALYAELAALPRRPVGA